MGHTNGNPSNRDADTDDDPVRNVGTDDDPIRYVVHDGTGKSTEAVVFCADVGLGPWSVAWQHGALAGRWTTVVPETRGIGGSVIRSGQGTVSQFVTDLDSVLGAAGVRTAHVVGFGLGGMIALAYAHRSGRPTSLVLVGTAASGGAYDPAAVWADPADRDAVRERTRARLSDRFGSERPDVIEEIVDWRVAEDADPTTYRSHASAVESFDMSNRLFEVTVPTLVVHGSADFVCPITSGAELAQGLPRGRLYRIDEARHFVGIEASAAVNDVITGWIAEHGTDPLA